ncbi:hypothetical protein [Streptomyces roseifaciens]|uniref:hypothetical protein n=1 Tax=Streptomyces roseifaciens TaxID=1488406 RepID=UPI0013667CF7|nr:hypothetical protein [Streptomyces roseifaciens]
MSASRSQSGLVIGLAAFNAALTTLVAVVTWRDGVAPWAAAAVVSLVLLLIVVRGQRRS